MRRSGDFELRNPVTPETVPSKHATSIVERVGGVV